jgi:ATP-binding cassette subfamily C protein
VLRDISLSLPARRAIGIIGLSGAGKSSLADIVAGLAQPTSGKLIVDGRAIGESERSHWRGGVTYVPQDAPLFHDTVRANLLIGARNTTEDELWRCLALTGAFNVVRKLPLGLETVVGDRGAKLSGGERQRLRLASALLRKPQLLILDEATSALNPIDEAAINRSLRTLLEATTIIIIAHRASSVAWTDQLVVLDQGRLAYAGASKEAAMRYGGLEGDWSQGPGAGNVSDEAPVNTNGPRSHWL